MIQTARGILAAVFILGASPAVEAAPITALAFSPDGKALVGARNRQIAVFSPEDGSLRNTLDGGIGKVQCLVFSPDGQWLLAGGGAPGEQGSVALLNWPEGRVRGIERCGEDLVMALATRPDGTAVAIAGADHRVQTRALSASGLGERVLELTGHSGPVLGVAYSPDASLLVTVSADRSVKVWSGSDGRLIRSLGHHTDAAHAVAFHPRGKEGAPWLCATASEDRTVRVWQPGIGRMVRIIRQAEGALLALAFSPTGDELYAAGEEGVIRALDPGMDAVRRVVWRGGDWIYALAVSPDGRRLASGDWRGEARVHPISAD